MEKLFELILSKIDLYIDWPYILTFMLLGYVFKKHFQTILNKLFKKNVKTVFVILILAALVAIPYLLCGAEWQKILFSYALGTSLHETAFTWIENKIKKPIQ